MKIFPKKSLGQNFLIDEIILNKIAELGEIKKFDKVIEVGPGTGNLTEKIIQYINNNMRITNPYSSSKEIIKQAQDPRLQAEGKAGQSTEMGVIFLSSKNFSSEPGSEWVIGTCIKSPCVAAGNNELVSIYR